MRKRLTQKQETFCLKYFELGNASEAARIALYSPRTAAVIGRENLLKPQIIERIDQLRQLAEDASIATVVERKQRLTEIARANIPDYVDDVSIRVDKESPNVGAVSEITTRTRVYRNEPVVITNLKLHNPIQAIAELNKMERIYEPDGATVNVDNRKVEINIGDPKEKLLSLLARLATRAGETEGDKSPEPEGS